MAQTGKSILTIYCNCSYYDLVPEDTKKAVIESISEAGIEFEAVSDLCLLIARRDPVLQKWAEADTIRIAACYPRAIRWLFEAGAAPLPVQNVEIFNMRTQKTEDIIDGLLSSRKRTKEKPSPGFKKDSDWVPWFPVIDYSLCKNCKQCMNFCLFGVYGLSEENIVEVQNPSHCKTNCPACARVCPHTAIIFPKYGECPINGDEIDEQTLDTMGNSELSEALSGNVYDAIRRRSRGRKRFSSVPSDSAPEDSLPSLDKLRRELNIPADVISSLSPAEIHKIYKKSQEDKPQQSRAETNSNIRKDERD